MKNVIAYIMKVEQIVTYYKLNTDNLCDEVKLILSYFAEFMDVISKTKYFLLYNNTDKGIVIESYMITHLPGLSIIMREYNWSIWNEYYLMVGRHIHNNIPSIVEYIKTDSGDFIRDLSHLTNLQSYHNSKDFISENHGKLILPESVTEINIDNVLSVELFDISKCTKLKTVKVQVVCSQFKIPKDCKGGFRKENDNTYTIVLKK